MGKRTGTKGVNQLRAGVALSYINLILGNIIPIIYTPWMLSLLGKDQYGLYTSASSIVSYLGLLSLGMGTAVIRYLSKALGENDIEQYRKLYGLFLNIFRVIAALCLIGGTVLTFLVDNIYGGNKSASEIETMRILVLLMSVNVSIGFLFSPYTSVITSYEKYIFLQIVNIFVSILPAFANIAILYIWPSPISLICISLTLNILIRFVYGAYIKKAINIKPLYKKPEKNLLKELFFFTFWVFIATLVNQLQSQTDKVIIGYAMEFAWVGIYQIGATFEMITQNISLNISNVLTPKITKIVSSLCNDGNMRAIDELLIRVGRLQFYVVSLIVSGFAVFGRQFIYLWVGDEYGSDCLKAYWVALLLIVPSVVPLIQNVAYSSIVALNKHKFRSIVYLCVAIANVATTIPAVYNMGIVGAALMTNICSVIGTWFVMNWYYWKRIRINIPKFWRVMLPRFALPAAMTGLGIFASHFIDFSANLLILLVGIIVYTIIFFTLNWLIYMNNYEKDVFRKPVYAVINKIKKK